MWLDHTGCIATNSDIVECCLAFNYRQTASAIAKSAGTVVVETLNVAGMVRNRRLAKALTDAAVGGFLRELEWQCAKRGVLLLKAGLWFPSTQLCARCGGRPNARIDLS